MSDYTEQLNQARAKDNQKDTSPEAPDETESETQISTFEFILIGILAVMNDLCDWIGLDLIFFRMIDLCTAAILGLWCWFRLKKFPGTRFGISFLVELIPFLGDISPTWTIFVITTYAEQRGIAGPLKTLSKITKFIKQ